MKKALFLFLSIAVLSACSSTDYTAYVDTSIGTGGHGHTFLGASVPFGLVQVGPTNLSWGWDWCSGYHVSDSSVLGFSQTHCSGPGIGDLADITIMPVSGKNIKYEHGDPAVPESGFWSKGDFSEQVNTPSYFSVPLERYGILAEMTATARVGFMRFTYKEGSTDNAVIVNLQDGEMDEPFDTGLDIVDSSAVTGHRFSAGWAKDQRVWFKAEFSRPFSGHEQHGAYWRFDFQGDQPVSVKVAISPSSTQAADKNLIAEIPDWDFEAVKKASMKEWNKELGKIDIQTNDQEAKTIFYTALYHSMISPILFSDNGEPDRYSIFSLWDTYRAQMPLFAIIHPDREVDVMKTFLDIHDKQGKLPVWHLWGNETDTMVGIPGAIVAADAVLKGFGGFDAERMYQAMKASAMLPERGQEFRLKYGYIPSDLTFTSVAEDEEFCIADAGIAKVAKMLGHQDDYEYFFNRSKSYKKHFDKETGFMRGIDTAGIFREPFNPFFSDHSGSDYCEGNAWQYIWLVPQDFDGLVDCFGGTEPFIKQFDTYFNSDSAIEGENASPDISGMIGQYAHGNEPSHHDIYFYTLAGQPWKTADLVRKICSELYKASPDGLCGNEDCGQMSAWYILSALGIFQVDPSGGDFVFGSPIFNKATISLPEGKKLSLEAKNNSDTNRYIQKITVNGEEWKKNAIDYQTIMAGVKIVFEMGPGMTDWTK